MIGAAELPQSSNFPIFSLPLDGGRHRGGGQRVGGSYQQHTIRCGKGQIPRIGLSALEPEPWRVCFVPSASGEVAASILARKKIVITSRLPNPSRSPVCGSMSAVHHCGCSSSPACHRRRMKEREGEVKVGSILNS